jgi:hypothetical protein
MARSKVTKRMTTSGSGVQRRRCYLGPETRARKKGHGTGPVAEVVPVTVPVQAFNIPIGLTVQIPIPSTLPVVEKQVRLEEVHFSL